MRREGCGSRRTLPHSTRTRLSAGLRVSHGWASVRTSDKLGRYLSARRTGCANERPSGSVRGAPGNWWPYRDQQLTNGDSTPKCCEWFGSRRAIRTKLLYMSRFPFFVFALAIVLCCVATTLSAQMTNGSDTAQSSVVLSSLSPPIYPPLARQAHIWGDVNLTLRIRQDGSVESTALVSGHAMLKQAALDSAQKSEFECHGCSEALTSYSLVYTFKFTEKKCCTETDENEPQLRVDVTQSQNHVTILTDTACICDPSADVRRVRSAKCIYLWRCAFR